MKINWKKMIKQDQEKVEPEKNQEKDADNTENSSVDIEVDDTPKKKSGKKSKAKSSKEQIENLQLEIDETKDKYLRLFAEFDNYKKRSIKEKLDFMRTASQETITAILPVLDDFDRAKRSADDDNSVEQFSEGVTMVYNKLNSIMTNLGVVAMESTGEVFDPELHEAVTEIPAGTEEMKGKIIDTIEKGFLLRDKIIRHAKVVVGK